jgi:hypothetical protein
LCKAFEHHLKLFQVIRFQHIALQGPAQRLDSTLATKVLLKLSLCARISFPRGGPSTKAAEGHTHRAAAHLSLTLLLALRAGSCSLMQSIPKARRPMKFVKTTQRTSAPSYSNLIKIICIQRE